MDYGVKFIYKIFNNTNFDDLLVNVSDPVDLI